MALLDDDDGRPPAGDGWIRIWKRSDGMNTVELELTDHEAQRLLPALEAYYRGPPPPLG